MMANKDNCRSCPHSRGFIKRLLYKNRYPATTLSNTLIYLYHITDILNILPANALLETDSNL